MATYVFYALAAYAAYTAYRANNQNIPQQTQEGPRLRDAKVAGSAFGTVISDLSGSARLAGNIIWADDIVEVAQTREVHVDGPNNDYDLREYFYFTSFAVQLCKGPIIGVRKIWANNKLVYSQSEDADSATLSASNAFAQYMTIYTGTETQMPDPTIAAKEGLENTSAYRGTAYIVFEQLPLKDFQNNFPQLSFEVVQSGSVTGTQITRVDVDLSLVINSISARAGIDPLRVDASGVSETVKGLLISGSTYVSALSPALAAYNVDAFQSGYKLKFRRVTDADVIDIDESDLGRMGKNALKIRRKKEAGLPAQMSLVYYDYDRDYLSGTQRAQRIAGRSKHKAELKTELCLSAGDAVKMAEVAMYSEWLKRLEYELKLPPKYLGTEPGDIIRLNSPSRGLLSMRASKVRIGADNSLEVDAESWVGTVLTSLAAGSSGLPPDGTVRISGDTVMHMLDINAVADAYASGPYLMFSLSGESPWRSCVLYKSSDLRSSYQPVLTAPAYSTYGLTDTALPNGVHTVWDNDSTVDVVIERGSLSSSNDAAVLAGANMLLVGDEIIQFVNATLIDTNTWRLSRLLRGRRGTEIYKASHGIGERVVFLGSAYTLAMSLSEVGSVRWFRAPSQDQLLADSPESSIVYQANCLKPYAPCFVRGARDGGANLSITWIRRSRIGAELPSGTDIPLGEASERYEVEIMNGASPVRSTIVTSPSFVYTSAMQVADFGSNQASVAINIFQLSESIGRGYAASATL